MKIKEFLKLMLNPRALGVVFLQHPKLRVFSQALPDSLFLKCLFFCRMNKRLNLNNPTTFSEKLQWLKLYDHNPMYTKLVDKNAVKEYVKDVIGEEYVIPTIGIWNDVNDIDFSELPDKFVLKCTHDSGGLVICQDKKTLNIDECKTKLSICQRSDYYAVTKEWPYKNVPRQIIAEQYIESSSLTNDLPDYKFFCFDGHVRSMFIATERQKPGEDVKFDFFDTSFNFLPFRQGHDHALTTPLKPKHFELMIELAEKLSKGIPHVRVDFYDTGDRVFFGEMTLYHFSGMMPFEPEEWDYRFGSWLRLPKN